MFSIKNFEVATNENLTVGKLLPATTLNDNTKFLSSAGIFEVLKFPGKINLSAYSGELDFDKNLVKIYYTDATGVVSVNSSAPENISCVVNENYILISVIKQKTQDVIVTVSTAESDNYFSYSTTVLIKCDFDIQITVYPNGGKFADGTTGPKTFLKSYGDYFGGFGITRDNYLMSGYTESTSETTPTMWEDTVVTRSKTIYCNWNLSIKLTLSNTYESNINAYKVVVKAGGRVRHIYKPVTTTKKLKVSSYATVMNVYNDGDIIFYNEQDTSDWEYKVNLGTTYSIGSGLGCKIHVSGVPFNTIYFEKYNYFCVSYLNYYYGPIKTFYFTSSSGYSHSGYGWPIDCLMSKIPGCFSIYDVDETEVYIPPA